MSQWQMLATGVEVRLPFLKRLRFPGTGGGTTAMPGPLTALVGVADSVAVGRAEAVAVLVPRLYQSAVWVGVCAALGAMQRDFETALLCPPAFQPGDRLLIDSHYVVEYDGEREDGYWLLMKNGSLRPDRVLFPKAESLRLQPTTTLRPLTPTRRPGKAPDDPLDDLLGIKAHGNRNVFRSRVIVVTSVTAGSALLRTAGMAAWADPAKVSRLAPGDLMQWGKIKVGGEVELCSNGKRDAAPTLLLASDLIAVRDYLRSTPTRSPFIIIDGAARFRSHPDVLNSVVSEGARILACVERADTKVSEWSRRAARRLPSKDERRFPSSNSTNAVANSARATRSVLRASHSQGHRGFCR